MLDGYSEAVLVCSFCARFACRAKLVYVHAASRPGARGQNNLFVLALVGLEGDVNVISLSLTTSLLSHHA
jgi:hypothetical protein